MSRLVRRSQIDHRKAFLPRRRGETIVERDNFRRRGASLGGQERRGELQRIGGSQGVDTKKSCRRFPDSIARIDLVPAGRKLSQPPKCKRHRSDAEGAVTFEASQSRNALDFGTPPDEYGGVLRSERLEAPG